jgi:hypothetical protein
VVTQITIAAEAQPSKGMLWISPALAGYMGPAERADMLNLRHALQLCLGSPLLWMS